MVGTGAKSIEMISSEKRFSDDDLPYLKLKAVDENELIIVKHDVGSDCSIKEFIETKKLIFKRGYTFYEFKNETESITEDQHLMLFKTVNLIMFIFMIIILNVLCNL